MALVTEQHKFKLKRDDTVEIIAGKDKGKRGKVLKILRDKDRVLVEGVNIVKKAQKRRKQTDRGGIIEIEAPLHSSNVMIICKKCGPTRIGYKMDGEKKVRVCRKCKEAL
ncbi:MAG: 50S ribosomal protein L24 [Spirochaetaceae bacterium]|jgi:large subunit ribosomal protein L24|nr:50S ribosomal protein L24 [Spirochaetaceae bacterium]